MSDDQPDISALQAENAALRRRVAELESTAARLRALFSMWDDLLMVIDKDGRYLEFAPSLSPLATSVDPAFYLGKFMHEVLPAEVADQYLSVILRALATREIVKFEYMLPVNGRTAWFHGTVTPLSETTVLWFARDITDQRQLVELEEELRTFQVLADNAPDGISLSFLDGKFFYANQAYRAMSGYGDVLLSKSAYDLIAGPSEVVAAINVSLRQHGIWQGELDLRRANGEIFPSQICVMLLPRANKKEYIYAAILRDLTPERRAEKERLALSAQVIEAQKAALRELSTPLVPVADGVIAMPLIGAIDAVRAQEVMEKLLTGITALRARTAILDITGVKVVDATVADALLKVARAARLLGANVVLTGIGPEVAEALVQLGADLRGIVTLGTLQSGIAYALKQR